MNQLKSSSIFQFNKLSIAFILLLILLLTIARGFVWYNDNGEQNMSIIESDGKGYYRYLPELFIEADKGLKENDPLSDKKVNKYFVGTAVCMSPFFLAGYIGAVIFKYPTDGYSFPFQIGISLAGIFYLLFGLWLLSRLLSQFGFSNRIILLTIVSILFGSNLLNYGVLNPSMSHVYSFFCISAFLYCFNTYLISLKGRFLFFSALLLGLTIIIRPTNGMVVLLIPFLFLFNASKLKSIITVKNSLIVLLPIVAVGSLQLASWHAQTNQLFVWGYENEGFYFSKPQIIEVLFGFRKGWFIYTPLALLSMIGLVPLYRKDKRQFFSIALFLAILIYVTSSWWNWYYGPSFGMRPFVDFYALNAILLAYLIKSVSKTQFKVLVLGLTLMISLNLFQTYQYEKVIMSSWDMNFEKYKAIFGVFEQNKVIIGGTHDILPYQSDKKIIYKEEIDIEGSQHYKQGYDSIVNAVVADFTGIEYSLKVEKTLNHTALSEKGLYLEVSLKRFEKELNNSRKAKLIVDMMDSLGQSHYYYWTLLNEVPANKIEWKEWNYELLLPSAKTQSDKLKIYIRNEEKNSFQIRDFKFELSSL